MSTTATAATPSPPAQPLSRARLVGRRLVAAGIDLLLLPSMLSRLGDILVGGVGEWVGRVLGVAAAIGLQGLVGASFGMAVVGLVVVRAGVDGEDPTAAPGLRRAALRHVWILALLLPLLPSLLFSVNLPDPVWVVVTVAASLLGLVGVALPPLLLGTVIADDDGRGLHDRWSGTSVQPTPAPRHPVATVGILLLLWATLTGAAWWLGEPDRVKSDRIGSAVVDHATCDVRYDPSVGDPQQHTVELTRGMERTTVRLGPHVVRFDDEPFPTTGRPSYSDVDEDGTEGLFYEVLAQSAGGTSSSSTGGGTNGSFTEEVEIDGALTGALAMECRGEGDTPEPFTPTVRPSD